MSVNQDRCNTGQCQYWRTTMGHKLHFEVLCWEMGGTSSGLGVAGSTVPHSGISSGGQQMASSPKLAICPSWITSLTHICHPPAPSFSKWATERNCVWFVSVGAKHQNGWWHQLHREDTASGQWWKGCQSALLGCPAVSVCKGRVNISHQKFWILSQLQLQRSRDCFRLRAAGSGQSFKNPVSVDHKDACLLIPQWPDPEGLAHYKSRHLRCPLPTSPAWLLLAARPIPHALVLLGVSSPCSS